ncbi:SpoVT / AbrB like domain protein [Pelotomaculum sp. FP]|uniref:AbrB/MazE/SpoVT family DNA-binding domain-containing protein n=1 Tax=Pelotomaculum sp. FP TaxID=261474 RepID=UPI001065630E|nr:AbrB/MazE/SpoVT family DNA-binding domain-containing protein [Pelotomaculum sp. FP]TEB16951.1 SpoVT / AbrB like domain protein [Pelotomaculum sp. FP]
MGSLSCLTPNGQVTIPRQILKTLGIGAGNQVYINIEKGRLVLRKVEVVTEKENSNTRVEAVPFF